MNLSRSIRQLTPAQGAALSSLVNTVKSRSLRAIEDMTSAMKRGDRKAATRSRAMIRNVERLTKRWLRATAKVRGEERAHAAGRERRKARAKARRAARSAA